jgi:hypothetical protein
VGIQALFGLSVLMSFVAFGLVTKLYIWPRLRILERDDALIPLVLPHTFRFIGLSFLVPGVVSTSPPAAFAAPAAYGDLAEPWAKSGEIMKRLSNRPVDGTHKEFFAGGRKLSRRPSEKWQASW